MSDIDYAKIGFRCGLEIHQQLATDKLFCRCRTDAPDLDEERPDFVIRRRLRPTQSELGEIDAAALAQARRNQNFEYRGFRGYSCLVETDDEPPHEASAEALDVTLTLSLLLDAQPVGELQWMRKIVIDGSNTSGFQRTGLVARGGHVLDVAVQSMCLEEDSCRRVKEVDDTVVWALDRLGVPLIEIATEPQVRDAAHAKEVAARIGALLRSTGRVKRGLGTIRQDLNVSIEGGNRVEVKGVQDLNGIPRVIDYEVRRQLRMNEIRDELAKRSVSSSDFSFRPVDVSDIFSQTQAKFLAKTLDSGGVVLGHTLPKMRGLLGSAQKDSPRLGKELAAYAKQASGVRGVLHSDELPGMGISQDESDQVRKRLGVNPTDAYVLVAEQAARARRGLEAAVERAALAGQGVLPEVRAAQPDFSTHFMRPMPGAARMYPETDVPPVEISTKRVDALREKLPPRPEERVQQLRSRFGLGNEEATQLVQEGLAAEFDALAATGDPSLAARTLLAFLPDAVRQSPDRADLIQAAVGPSLQLVAEGRLAKEGIPDVLVAIAQRKADDAAGAVEHLGMQSVDDDAVQRRAREIVQERIAFVRERGAASVGPLMGVVMKDFRGKVDGKRLSDILRREVERVIEPRTA